jgi:hypothetical protein
MEVELSERAQSKYRKACDYRCGRIVGMKLGKMDMEVSKLC